MHRFQAFQVRLACHVRMTRRAAHLHVGICLAYKMQHQMDPNTWELAIYEKNDNICGTWYENKSVSQVAVVDVARC